MSEATPNHSDVVTINISDEESSHEAMAQPATVNGESSKPDETTEAATDATNSTNANEPTDTNNPTGANEPTEAATPAPAETNGTQANSNSNVDPPLPPGVKVEEICAHGVDKAAATVNFLVNVEGGSSSWQRESDMQERDPEMVKSYWEKFDSREHATSLVTYHVFRILRRKQVKRKIMLLVQWTGYTEEDATWETLQKIETIAPDVLTAFERERRSGRSRQPAVQGAKRPADRGPGRPRKKARAADDE